MGNSRRDHGGLIFVDLRESRGNRSARLQSHAQYAAAHEVAGSVRSEFFLAAKGKVVRRGEGTVNADLPTGEIEVAVTEMRGCSTPRLRRRFQSRKARPPAAGS